MGMYIPIDLLEYVKIEVRLTRSNDGAQASCQFEKLLGDTESSYGAVDDLKFY